MTASLGSWVGRSSRAFFCPSCWPLLVFSALGGDLLACVVYFCPLLFVGCTCWCRVAWWRTLRVVLRLAPPRGSCLGVSHSILLCCALSVFFVFLSWFALSVISVLMINSSDEIASICLRLPVFELCYQLFLSFHVSLAF